jgi:hypothetical protein
LFFFFTKLFAFTGNWFQSGGGREAALHGNGIRAKKKITPRRQGAKQTAKIPKRLPTPLRLGGLA